MDNYLTVKQFAEAANVSTQRIYQRLAKDLQPFCKTENGKKYLSSEALKLFGKEDLQSTCQDLATDKAYIDNLLQQIDKLNERLDKAEEERERLNAERQTTLARLFKTEDENKALKLELNEYKAIANKKETVVDVSAEDQTQPTEQPTQELAEDPPQQKLSFFKRLFKRK